MQYKAKIEMSVIDINKKEVGVRLIITKGHQVLTQQITTTFVHTIFNVAELKTLMINHVERTIEHLGS